MEASTWRQILLLAVLLVVFGALTRYQLQRWEPAGPPRPASNAVARRPAGSDGGPGNGALSGPAGVRLEALSAARPQPPEAERNPFRFQPKAPPPPSAPPKELAPARSAEPAAPPAPPPPPTIPLKFIGLVDAPKGPGKVAVLSDGRFVYYGQEGDIIDGRFRVVRIGVESVVMEYVDGRGRQTIRLSGS